MVRTEVVFVGGPLHRLSMNLVNLRKTYQAPKISEEQLIQLVENIRNGEDYSEIEDIERVLYHLYQVEDSYFYYYHGLTPQVALRMIFNNFSLKEVI